MARPETSPAAAAARGVAASRLRRVIPIFESLSSTCTPRERFESTSFAMMILFKRRRRAERSTADSDGRQICGDEELVDADGTHPWTGGLTWPYSGAQRSGTP